jgi:phosphoadenosine phosphosulfate reductase
MQQLVATMQPQAEAWSAEEVLRWAFAEFGSGLAIASAFGAEGMVMIDLAAKIRPDSRVFTLDTDFLFPETYALMERIEARYRIRVERVRAGVTPEEQTRQHGPHLWKTNPDLCCQMRKVEPLRLKLAELQAYATAIRRDQTPARASAQKIEWDQRFSIVKVNPLADWSSDDVWDYIRAHHLEYNPLHDQHYPSIGCTHCTRAVLPGEEPRAGRWAGLEKTECGLHERRPTAALIPEAELAKAAVAGQVDPEGGG